MTSAEFEALEPRLGRLALDTIKVARAVLVDGLSPSQAARHFGMTRQRVHGIIGRFRAAAEQTPRGWRYIQVCLPPDLAEEVEALAAKAREAYDAEATREP